MAMYIGQNPPVNPSQDKPDNLRVCGETCFRHILYKERERVCYVGSSEGTIVIPGQNCAWGFTEASQIDRGTPNIENTVKK